MRAKERPNLHYARAAARVCFPAGLPLTRAHVFSAFGEVRLNCLRAHAGLRGRECDPKVLLCSAVHTSRNQYTIVLLNRTHGGSTEQLSAAAATLFAFTTMHTKCIPQVCVAISAGEPHALLWTCHYDALFARVLASCAAHARIHRIRHMRCSPLVCNCGLWGPRPDGHTRAARQHPIAHPLKIM